MAAFALGAALLAGAIAFALRRTDSLQVALAGVRDKPLLALLALLLPLANLAFTAMTFWTLTPPAPDGHARVARAEMGALLAAANAANYLPLRPGMLSRVAYHRAANAIPVAESLSIVLQAMGATAVALASLLAVVLGARAASLHPAALSLSLLSVPLVAWAAASPMPPRPARFTRGVAWRSLDMLAWMARYAIVFAMVGVPLDATGAACITLVAQAAMIVPLAGNGMGVREWAIGLLAPMLPAALLAQSASGPEAISADLLNRGFELLVNIPLGLAGAVIIARRWRRLRARASPEPAP